jgi:hypothetical protein
MRAILSKSGSKCAAKVVALSQPKDRAFYLNSTHLFWCKKSKRPNKITFQHPCPRPRPPPRPRPRPPPRPPAPAPPFERQKKEQKDPLLPTSTLSFLGLEPCILGIDVRGSRRRKGLRSHTLKKKYRSGLGIVSSTRLNSYSDVKCS